MSWPKSPIGEHTKKIKTWNPVTSGSADPFDYIDLASVDKEKKQIDLTEVPSIFPADAPSRARQIVHQEDVIVATVRPNLNGVSKVPGSLHSSTASTGYCVLRANDESLDSNYLFYWLQTRKFIQDMMSKATGANYPAVSDRIIKESTIPLPPLAEQKRIAAILDKADAIRRKRQQAIQLADEFLRSVFLDMFGDPVTNPKGWEVKPLKEMAVVTTGNTPSKKKPEYYGGFIEWIKSDNINTPNHILTKAKDYLSSEGSLVGRKVLPGSILVTCIAGSFDCIGNAAYTDREVAFNQQINALTPKAGINSWFLYALVLFSKKHIQAASTNSMKGMISKGKMEDIPFVCPPKNLQNKFEAIFNRYLLMRHRLDISSNKLTDTFYSLSKKAFSGNL